MSVKIQRRFVSLNTAIVRTEEKLITLQKQIQENRAKGRKQYQNMVYASTASESQTNMVTVTATKSSGVQISKQTDMVNTAPIREKEPTSMNITLASIIEDTHAKEQKLAAKVQ